MVGGNRWMVLISQDLADNLVKAEALSFRQARIRDILQRRVANAPGRVGGRGVVAYEQARLLELLKLVERGALVDDRHLLHVEVVHEHGCASSQLPQPGWEGVQAGADDRLHSGRNRCAR